MSISCAEFIQALRPNGPGFIHIYSPGSQEPSFGIDGYRIEITVTPSWVGEDDYYSDPFQRECLTTLGVDLYEHLVEKLIWASSNGLAWDEDFGGFDALITPEGIWVYNYGEDADADPEELEERAKAFIPAGVDMFQDVDNFSEDPEAYLVPLDEGPVTPGFYFLDEESGAMRGTNPCYWDELRYATPHPDELGWLHPRYLGPFLWTDKLGPEGDPETLQHEQELRLWAILMGKDPDELVAKNLEFFSQWQ